MHGRTRIVCGLTYMCPSQITLLLCGKSTSGSFLNVGLETNSFREIFVWVVVGLRLFFVELQTRLVPPYWQRIQPNDSLKVNVMIGL